MVINIFKVVSNFISCISSFHSINFLSRNLLHKNCILKAIAMLATGILLSSCGGSGDGSVTDNGPITNSLNKGVFVDSSVQGLTYTINSVSGLTNKKGEFEYKTGDLVAFSIGHILIGETVAKEVVTPLDLGYGIDSIELDNLLRLLQTLDEDGYSSNGISLNNQALERASLISLPNLNLPEADFESDESVLELIKLVVDKDGLIDRDLAKQHFLNVVAQLNESGYLANVDADKDGVADNLDHFPNDPNETQDIDGNGIGDIADNADNDIDGIANHVDNCPKDYNPGQEDIDKDMIGDVCDKYLPIKDPSNHNGVVLAELRSGGIYYNESLVENAEVVYGPGSMARDFTIFDYDGPGIGTYRDCSVDHIDCTPTRDCTASHIDCTATRDCTFTKLHDTRDCKACILKNIFTGGCSIWGNDPVCEAAKAAQNAIYDTEYAAKKLDCERIKSSEKLVCEADKSAWKLDCERIKTSEKAVCEADKSLVKFDCEKSKTAQMVAGELWEVAIQESRSQAHSENPRQIPSFIRSVLEPFFDAELLDSVYWTEDHGNIFSVASKLATEIGGRGAVTLGDIIVFKSTARALYDVGVWAHELEHVKQYKLLGIDHFAEYYADYWINETINESSDIFKWSKFPSAEEYAQYVSGKINKIEALGSAQSVYVCSIVDPEKSWYYSDIYDNSNIIIMEDRRVCRSSYY